ncbi:serine/threonine-protein kinase HAL4/sat4 [Phlyctochytrium bullatum]|nr:serine/threonine-protein kinase HAL4/sat4 [Phlyctochytrium bullatum]
MSGTLSQPVPLTIAKEATSSPQRLSVADNNSQRLSVAEIMPRRPSATEAPPSPLPVSKASSGGIDFETIAAIGEGSEAPVALSPGQGAPTPSTPSPTEKHHNPFNFFKPLHMEHNNSGSGDIFKDLLTNHRHRRAASSHASDKHSSSESATGKVLNRSMSDAFMHEKYKRHDEILGKGANAVVRLAHKQSEGDGEMRLFAVKEFRKRRRGEHPKEYVKKVIAEFCISSSMHHDNVIQTIDLIQDENDRWCEVMEYMPGGDLFTRISNRTLTDMDEIHCYYKQLLAGVAYIHSMGVAHRDLKPENLLLDSEHRVLKIADFGVSEVFRTVFEKSSRKAKGVCGSEPYIAPEEWDEDSEYDGSKVDIWACVPWRVAKQQDPHYNDYLTKRRPEAGSGFYTFDKLHPGPRKLFYKILDPNPELRPNACDLLTDEWLSKQEVCHFETDENSESPSSSPQPSKILEEGKADDGFCAPCRAAVEPPQLASRREKRRLNTVRHSHYVPPAKN